MVGKGSVALIRKLKKNLEEKISTNPEISLFDYYYFTTWAKTLGNYSLKTILEKRLMNLDNIIFLLKEVIKYSIQDLDIIKSYGKIKNKNSKNLIISYSNYKTVNKKINDNYFSTRISNLTKANWILINSGSLKKKNLILPENAKILSKEKNFFFLFRFRFYINLIKYLFLIIFLKKKIYNKKFYFFLRNEINKFFKKTNYVNIFMPYESQPHQHFIIKTLKNINKNIKIIGYLHSSLVPFPADFIFKKKYEPDTLIVHGDMQKKILVDHLGWKSNLIKVKNSFRYKKKKKNYFINKIFLPYSIINSEKLIENFMIFLKLCKINLQKFRVINHPQMFKSKVHLNFIKKLKILMSNKKDLKTKKKISIVFGSSAVILEALENESEVVHIFSNSNYEKHDQSLWKGLIIKKIHENIYSYKIKKKGAYIKFAKKNSFENFINEY